MDDLHLEPDLFFGPCNDPSCPGSKLMPDRGPLLDLSWPGRGHLRLVASDDQPPEFG